MYNRLLLIFILISLLLSSSVIMAKRTEVNLNIEPYAEATIEGSIEGDSWYKGTIAEKESPAGTFTGKPGETRWADDVGVKIISNTTTQIKFDASDPVNNDGLTMPNMKYEVWQMEPSTFNNKRFGSNGSTTFDLNPGQTYNYGVFAQSQIPNDFWSVESGNYHGTIKVTVSKL